MNNQDFTITILVNKTAAEAFEAINSVRAWWTENVEGDTQKLNDEFSVRFGDVHYSRQKLTEVVPGEKVVWLVTDSRLTFIKDQGEWTNTRITFQISEQGDKTLVRFTQSGLVPGMECFNDCSNAWTYYIQTSLFNLITTGKGQPTLKQSEVNANSDVL